MWHTAHSLGADGPIGLSTTISSGPNQGTYLWKEHWALNSQSAAMSFYFRVFFPSGMTLASPAVYAE